MLMLAAHMPWNLFPVPRSLLRVFTGRGWGSTWLLHPSVLCLPCILPCIPFFSLHSQCPFHSADNSLSPFLSGLVTLEFGPGLCGAKTGLCPHCHPRPVRNCCFPVDTVNLKPDSVDGSCFLPQFSKAFRRIGGLGYLGPACRPHWDPAQPDLLLKLLYL